MRRNFTWIFLVLLCSGPTVLARQVPKQQTSPPRQVPLKEDTPPRGVQPTGEGQVSGYIYWDTSLVQHNPAAACNGLTATIGVGTSATGTSPTFEQFTSLGTYSNFSYLNDGSTLGVCAYTVGHLPIGKDLQVQISVTPSAFSQAVSASTPPTANDPNTPIKIPGGVCNKVTPAVPSPTVLGSRWWTCGDYAFNVNFVLKISGSGSLVGGTGGSLPAVQKPSAINQSAQKPLTNNDVFKMMQAGLPETIIITSIQSNPTKFDLSDSARITFSGSSRKGGGSNASNIDNIWNAMKAKGGALSGPGGTSADELNPQPYPPKRTTTTPGIAAQPAAGNSGTPNSSIKLGSPKTGPKMRNPRAAQAEAALVAVLQTQKQAADLEVARMKAAGRSGASTINEGTRAGLPAVQAPGKSQTFGSVPVSVLARQAQPGSLVLACANDPTMRIGNVSGSSAPATFTPIDKYNLYTITGCAFGDQAPTADQNPTDWVHVYGAGSFYGKFVIKFWSENSIVVSLDPSLSGFLDMGNVTLVVRRADGRETQKGGFQFYAARQTVPLKTIPQQYVILKPGGYFTSNYSAPAADVSGVPAEVYRYVKFHKDRPSRKIYLGGQYLATDPDNGNAYINAGFAGFTGDDFFDFSKLAPGFTTDSFQLLYWQADTGSMCGGNVDTLDTSRNSGFDGSWNPEWDGNNIRVWWQVQDCSELELFQVTEVRQSQYALQVLVNGPRGIDPWTGSPLPSQN